MKRTASDNILLILSATIGLLAAALGISKGLDTIIFFALLFSIIPFLPGRGFNYGFLIWALFVSPIILMALFFGVGNDWGAGYRLLLLYSYVFLFLFISAVRYLVVRTYKQNKLKKQPHDVSNNGVQI